MGKYLFYKHQVAGPFPEITEGIKKAFKTMIDNHVGAKLVETPFINDEMKANPNDVHVFEKSDKKKGK